MNTFRKYENGVLVESRNDSSNLGDKIARITQPIARTIDKVAGTKIAGCGGCRKMKDRLNTGMGITKALKLRLQGK